MKESFGLRKTKFILIRFFASCQRICVILSCTIMTQTNKLDQLLKSDQKLFHTQDLALLWDINNRNTLYTAIKRLLKRGVLIAVKKGLYSVLPLDQIDIVRLGPALIHQFCYLSTETVLAKEGIISQKVYPVTFVASLSRKIKQDNNLFVFRKLKTQYLFCPEGITQEGGVYIAGKERAVADMLYFNPKYYFDNSSLVDWEKVSGIQRKVGYKQ